MFIDNTNSNSRGWGTLLVWVFVFIPMGFCTDTFGLCLVVNGHGKVDRLMGVGPPLIENVSLYVL